MYPSTGFVKCLPLTTQVPGSLHPFSSRCWETSWGKSNLRKRATSQCSQNSSNQWKCGPVATEWSRALSHPPSPIVEITQERRFQQSLDMWTRLCSTPVQLQLTGTGPFRITIQYRWGPKGRTVLHCERIPAQNVCDLLFNTQNKHP